MGPGHHRWERLESTIVDATWRCSACDLVATTNPDAPAPRCNRGLKIAGVSVRRIPPCGDVPPRRYPSRHLWATRPVASESRMRWLCTRCAIEAETPISAAHPSGAQASHRFFKLPGGSWLPLTGTLPDCGVRV